MSWDDEYDADDGDRRRARAPATKWQIARQVAGYAAVVAGVVALTIGAVFGIGFLAPSGSGFEAPSANGPRVALPPLVMPLEEGEPVGGAPEASDDSTSVSGAEISPLPPVEASWTSQVADATGIPERAMSAYARAHVWIAEQQPGCGLDWATIAAIGDIESDHGRHGDSELAEDGSALPPIIGRALDGNGVATIEDTDNGLLDADTTWDRAVGPMQFIPSTWARWASDATGDGVADPHQIDDAAQTTARYLCASGPMTSAEGWRAAVFSYNHDNDYVDKVARVANEFAAFAASVE